VTSPGAAPVAAVDDAELHRRQDVSQRAFHRAVAETSPGGMVVRDGGGLQVTIVPAAARLALFNCVFYHDRAALLDALAAIRDEYRRAGVPSWIVWVPPWDREGARLLRDAGLSRGGALMVTAAVLAQLHLEPEEELELEPDPTVEMVAACNDHAHRLGSDQSMAGAFAGLGSTDMRVYAARHQGEVACAGLVRYDGDHCYPWGLAAAPAARGSLVAIELMRLILRDAIAAGCTTGSGEVTRAGETIGAYLGKRPIGRYDLWVGRSS